VQKLAEDKQRVQGRLIVELEGKLIGSITGQPQPLDPNSLPRYIVFYRGSSTCAITRKFTPALVKFYKEMKPAHPEFEVIYLMTEPVAETGKFAKAQGFSWRAVEYRSTPSMPMTHASISGLLPQLIVMDRTGKVLANGTQNAAPAALQRLNALLQRMHEKDSGVCGRATFRTAFFKQNSHDTQRYRTPSRARTRSGFPSGPSAHRWSGPY